MQLQTTDSESKKKGKETDKSIEDTHTRTHTHQTNDKHNNKNNNKHKQQTKSYFLICHECGSGQRKKRKGKKQNRLYSITTGRAKNKD